MTKMTLNEVNETDLINQVSNLAADLYSWKVLSRSKSIAEPPLNEVDQSKLAQASDLAKNEIFKPFVKEALCAALKATSNNIRDVARVVAATLLPLSIAGTISLPATPLAFAAAAVILFDIGVAAFCADHQDSDKSN